MKQFTQHRGVCAALQSDNIDTDQIIPSREMGRVSKYGFGEGLFAGSRFVYDGRDKVGLNPDFVLNQPAFANTTILLGGRNFGCGSSREHAVWALRDFGIRAIIAISFGQIFRNNCARNNVLAIELPAEQIEAIRAATESDPQNNTIEIDLLANDIRLPNDTTIDFSIKAFDRDMLLKGLDHIDYTLQYSDSIAEHVANDRQTRPWAYL